MKLNHLRKIPFLTNISAKVTTYSQWFGNKKKSIASLRHRRYDAVDFCQRDHLERKRAIFMASFEMFTMAAFSLPQLGEKKKKKHKKKQQQKQKRKGSSNKHVWCHCRSMRYAWYAWYLHVLLVLRCFIDTTSTVKKQIPLTRFIATII